MYMLFGGLFVALEVWLISKEYFHPGEMAPLQWTHSIRPVRDTPGVEYSARGLNTVWHGAYYPPNVVSPVILALSVSNLK
jgi:hypothetical protein